MVHEKVEEVFFLIRNKLIRNLQSQIALFDPCIYRYVQKNSGYGIVTVFTGWEWLGKMDTK